MDLFPGKETENVLMKVFLNELILTNVFGNLDLPELLPFRLACKTWKSVINQRISEDERVHIFRKGDSLDPFDEKVHYFKTLKIGTLSLQEDWTSFMTLTKPEDGNATAKWEISKEIEECGGQVKALELYEPGGVDLSVKHKINRFKTIFSIFPNLKNLEAKVEVNVKIFVEEFQDFIFPNLQVLNLNGSMVLDEGSEEDFVQSIFKVFPNLSSNFNCEKLDCVLMGLIKERKVTRIQMRKFLDSSVSEYSDCPELLKEVPSIFFPLTHLEIASIDIVEPEVLTEILKNFATTLTTVKLLADTAEINNSQYPTEIYVPPLPKVRNMRLEMPSFDYPENLYTYWNLGNQLGKDFPLLEYFVFKPHTDAYFFDEEEGTSHYFDDEIVFEEPCRKMWEPFVPLSAEDGEVDLSPLNFLKFADLSIPKKWIGPEENRDWGNQFLEVFLKLYGNSGRGTIQNMIDWLK